MALEIRLAGEFWGLLLIREAFVRGIIELSEEIGEVVDGGVLIRVLPFGIRLKVAEEGPPFSG